MTYMTVNELAKRLHYKPRYITQTLRPRHFTEGRHFIRPFGGRKVLYIWEHIEQDMREEATVSIPMANGGFCNG